MGILEGVGRRLIRTSGFEVSPGEDHTPELCLYHKLELLKSSGFQSRHISCPERFCGPTGRLVSQTVGYLLSQLTVHIQSVSGAVLVPGD